MMWEDRGSMFKNKGRLESQAMCVQDHLAREERRSLLLSFVVRAKGIR